LIGLPGTTDNVGRLVLAELDERGIVHRAGADLEGVDLVINVAGPFGEAGLAVVAAAVEAGAGYVDGCGDPAFADQVYAQFGTAPALVVPGCAAEQVIGDLAAAIAVADLGQGTPSEVTVSYDFGGAVPRSARPGRWPRRHRVRFPDVARNGVEVHWGERVRVPRWLPGIQVSTVLAVSDGAAAFLQLAGLTDPLSRFLPTPAPSRPGPGEFRVLAEARAGTRRAAIFVEAAGGFRLAARVLVEVARQAGGAGALTPAQALDPEPFLRSLTGRDLTWQRVDTRP
jgi:hypothetical protein